MNGLFDGFGPKGLNEGSQAAYCLEKAQKHARPEGYGLMGVNTDLPFKRPVWEGPETFGCQRAVGTTGLFVHTVPYGTDLFGDDSRH